jgi:chemotaxis protein histidine kinase CheA
MPSSEILAVLADEVIEAEGTLEASLASLAAASDQAAFQDAATEYLECIRRIAFASEALSLAGLKRVCDFIENNVTALGIGGVTRARQALLQGWPQLVLDYLKTPRDTVHCQKFVDLLKQADWPSPFDDVLAGELEQALLAFDGDDGTGINTGPERETVARPEDVVLEIPGDINPKLVDAFLTEGPMHASEYSALIQRVVRGTGWVDELQECRRLIHGLKGAANTVGVRGVATLSHHVEDILEYCVERATPPDGELARLLVKVADTLEMMFEALLGTGDAPADAQTVLQGVLDWINRIERGEGESVAPAAIPDSAVATPSADSASAAFVTRVADAKVEPKVRVSVRVIDNLLQTSGEIAISSGHVRERLQQAFTALTELRERHVVLWDRSNDLETYVTTQGVAAGRRQAHATANSVGAAGFDALELDQYNELHTHAHTITETVADLLLISNRMTEELAAVEAMAHAQALLNNELHASLMTSRMVPAGNLESRLQRTLRQVAEQCGKPVMLQVEGADVMLDDQMVNELIDPLQHLLRNAVDHGVEPVAIRRAAGKPDAGKIVLGFSRDGNYLLVTCRDDGAGLDLDRIRAHALAQGLVTDDQSLSDDDIARLILRSGFSTAASVTEVSGRGVGMDVVHTSVAKLKGRIDIRTEAGRGTTFTLRLPMSLGIVHCLSVVVGPHTLALPSDDLERLVYDGASHVKKSASGWRYDDGTIDCPAYALAPLVGFDDDAPEAEAGGPRHVVLMNHVDGKLAVMVDAVTGGNDLVIKKMGRYLANVRGVIGVSILGNGTVVPILDVAGLLLLDRRKSVGAPRAPRPGADAKVDILVVDDSLSVRTALATLLSEEGFRVRTAKDGVEAIEAIGERLPTAVLVDLEMPRMNGLELTTHIRTNAMTRNLPVILITSRTAEKHRHQARAAGVNAYVTKPYRENELLQSLRTLLSQAA